MADPSINLATLIHCIQNFHEEENVTTPVPLSVFIPLTTTTIIQGETSRQLPSPTNSSSRSTVVRSQSSSDVDSSNEQVLTQTLVPQENIVQINIEKEENTNEISSEKGLITNKIKFKLFEYLLETTSTAKSSSDHQLINETSPSTTSVPNNEEDDYI